LGKHVQSERFALCPPPLPHYRASLGMGMILLCRLSVLGKTGGGGVLQINENAAREENVLRFVVDKPRLKSESKEGDL
jgi:hypothetical protein